MVLFYEFILLKSQYLKLLFFSYIFYSSNKMYFKNHSHYIFVSLFYRIQRLKFYLFCYFTSFIISVLLLETNLFITSLLQCRPS